MRLKNYVIALAAISIVATISSCKKNHSDDSSADELKATVELSGDQAISDNLNADAENVLAEAAVDYDFAGGRIAGTTETMDILSCPVVTVTPLQGFPKTISIDFGAGCTSQSGITRSGKINVTLSNYLRQSGSVAVMTFDNYYVSGFKKEGTITWTNTSQGSVKSWSRACENGKITAPGGNYWVHSGTQTVVQTAGSDTPLNLVDDVFTTGGSATITNAAGITRTSEITIPLEKRVDCDNISKGAIKITGPSHYAIIDFGDGTTCDRLGTVSVDGSNPVTILLR